VLAAKKRALEADLERQYQRAVDAVGDEDATRRMPLEQAVAGIGESAEALTLALTKLDAKLVQPQHDFIRNVVPLLQVSRAGRTGVGTGLEERHRPASNQRLACRRWSRRQRTPPVCATVPGA